MAIRSAAMYRFLVRPKWIAFHLLVIGAVVLMVNLAFWQIRRLDERKDFNREVTTRAEQPIADFATLVTPATDPDSVEWRTVTATGTYVADLQLVVVNRGQAGQAGINVVTPLQLDDGRLLLVNRGFVPEPGTAPAPPAGTVTVEGRVRASQHRGLGQLSDPSSGPLTEVQRIDIPRIAEQLPGDVAQVYVDLLASRPSQGDVPIPLPDPELTEGPHLSYTIQWFIFSVCVLVGWVLAVRRSARKRAAELVSAAQPGVAADPDELTAGSPPARPSA